jgi:hypothetical protein
MAQAMVVTRPHPLQQQQLSGQDPIGPPRLPFGDGASHPPASHSSILLPMFTEHHMLQFARGWSSAPFVPAPGWAEYRRSMERLKSCIAPGNTLSMFDREQHFADAPEASPPPAVAQDDRDRETAMAIEQMLEAVLGSAFAGQELPDEDSEIDNGEYRVGRVGRSNMFWMLPSSSQTQSSSVRTKDLGDSEFVVATPSRRKKFRRPNRRAQDAEKSKSKSKKGIVA